MPQYEIELKWVGKKKRPKYISDEYGFYPNPPIVINASSKNAAKKKLKLPRSVKIKSIKKV